MILRLFKVLVAIFVIFTIPASICITILLYIFFGISPIDVAEKVFNWLIE